MATKMEQLYMKTLIALITSIAVLGLLAGPAAAKKKHRHAARSHHYASSCDYYCRYPLILGIGF